MILEKIKSEGLSHLSWFVGSGGEAVVIDPRRDVDVYVALARRHGLRITHVLETHRNEDLVSGAPALAARTGARVLHGPREEGEVVYADTARQGDAVAFGAARLEVLETPGHTLDSLSFVLYDETAPEGPVAVFTGDALFVGDVGRTDFYPGRTAEVAGMLHDSLQKLLALGDAVQVCPAHGAGSVCGSGMSQREFSTLGHERRNNPMLQHERRESFVDAKLSEHHEKPLYFKRMERLNLEGARPLPADLLPPPVAAADLPRPDEVQLVDVRSPAAFAGAHLPGSLSIPVDMLSAYAGWLLDPDRDIVLVCEGPDQARQARLHLARIGYDRVVGYHEGVLGLATDGRDLAALPMVDTETVRQRRQDDRAWTLVDVRSAEDYADAHIPGARHAYLGHLAERVEILPDGPITTMCSSGARAVMAASVLRAAGHEQVDAWLGSLEAWQEADGQLAA